MQRITRLQKRLVWQRMVKSFKENGDIVPEYRDEYDRSRNYHYYH